ncbi:MAG: ABC transporter permease [Defluviitaleaceae bacterium]|nr:ABC transporter permease [Defluviitaleaceae bacterium]
MTAFIAAYMNETDKLIRRKKYIAFIIIGVAICILWAVLGSVASGLLGQHGGLFVVLTPTPMGVLPFFLQVLLPLLIFMGVTDLITTEGADHTMKAMICRPVERWKLYMAKLMAVMTYVSLYLACVFTVSAVLNQTLGRGLGMDALMRALASYALTIPTLAVLAAFAAFIALFGRSGSLVMFLLVIMYLAMSVLPVFFPILSELLFTSFLGWHRLWIGVTPGASRMMHMLMVVAGYGIVFFMAGSLVFDRKEY